MLTILSFALYSWMEKKYINAVIYFKIETNWFRIKIDVKSISKTLSKNIAEIILQDKK